MNSYPKIFLFALIVLLHYQEVAGQRYTGQTLVEQFHQAQENVVLLENAESIIPLKKLESLRIAYLPIGFDTLEVNGVTFLEGQLLEESLANYTQITTLTPPLNLTDSQTKQWITKLQSQYNLLIIGIKNYTQRVRDPLPWKAYHSLIQQVCQEIPSIAVVVGRRQSGAWPSLTEAKGVLSMSHIGAFQKSVAAQIIFGGIPARAKLPFKMAYFPQSAGYTTEARSRFSFTLPELAGMNGQLLEDSIRAIVEEGIEAGAFPGAQVLVAKDGQVIYHHTFGHHTYAQQQAVQKNDLYDFASITKITGPLPALMRLHGEGKFELDAPLKQYIKVKKKSNKAELSFRQMLSHNAQLKPYIPYWIGTLKSSARYPWQEGWNTQAVNDEKFRAGTFRVDSTRNYNIKINDRLWLHRNYRKKIYKAIDRSPLNEKPGYVYSGLLFFLLPDMISDITGQDYETF